MDGKNNGFLKMLLDMYKNLPLKMRARVNITATELLEMQKGNNAFSANAGDRSAGDVGEDGHSIIKEDLL
jgi:hypothetical protein